MPRPRKNLTSAESGSSSEAEPALRTRSRRMSTPAFISSVTFSVVLVIVGAIFVGKSDRGQIDVTATIQNANQANREAYGDEAVIVNTNAEALRNLPNGGLEPQPNQESTPAPQPQAEASTTTADAETATTTESGDATTAETPNPDTSAESDPAPSE